MQRHSITVKVGKDPIIFETGHIARQANGAVIVRSGDTLLLNTACATPEVNPENDFLPLRVDYQEKLSAAGRTLSGFIKREGRPTEKETLVSRLIDRPIRPMFEDGYFNDVQILSYVLSFDGAHSPEPLAICGASAALVLSDIPFIKPIAGVRVGLIGETFIINPSIEEQSKSVLDLMLAGTEDAILMIEGSCDFLTEEQVLKGIEEGQKAIKTICEALSNWQKQLGKEKNRSTLRPLPNEVQYSVEEIVNRLLGPVLRISEKQKRDLAMAEVKETVLKSLLPEGKEPRFELFDIERAFKNSSSKFMRQMILNENKRSDGRTSSDIRPIYIQQEFLPRTHGSSLFTRGETQALAVCTLGGENMVQRFEDVQGEGSSRFYLQYSFPPYSVGEVGRAGPPGRREVGHGKLAERALAALIPAKEHFPYVVRLESNITESNGSSSMASVCGGCLAMMDAGIPIKRPVSGIAMGLILEGDKYMILSDILGMEDYLGDMDFKVTGDHEGITAFQMDIKVEGITHEIMEKALQQAKQGRIHILKKMLEVCPKPKEKMSSYAPRIESMIIKPSKIATVIGPGGKQIRAIIEQTGVQIDIDDSGRVNISSSNLEGIEKAKNIIHGLTAEAEIGKTYTGKVTSVVAFGAFVEILPGKEGLCHISEFDNMRIQNLDDYVKQGDEITVKLLDINDRGQLKLSRKAALARPVV